MASTNSTSSLSTFETTKTLTTATTSQTTTRISQTTSTSNVTTTNATTNRTGASTTNLHELTDGQKAGIAVGVIVFVIIIVAIIVFIAIRRKRPGQRPLVDGAPQDEEKEGQGENKHKRTQNKYVPKGPSKVDTPEVFYENPAAYADQSYYNVGGQNSDSAVESGSRKPAVMKQDSVPTIYAPPPPMENSRTSMPVEIAPNCPVIDEDEYIIPEDPSKITVPKRPPYTGHKPQNNDGEIYIDMGSAPGEELYIDPDLGQDQKSYMNFDAKSKPVKDEERKGVPKDYVNLSKEEKGIAFGVHPKEINATPKWEATTPVTINDEESYQNVLYENRSVQNKKPQRKK